MVLSWQFSGGATTQGSRCTDRNSKWATPERTFANVTDLAKLLSARKCSELSSPQFGILVLKRVLFIHQVTGWLQFEQPSLYSDMDSKPLLATTPRPVSYPMFTSVKKDAAWNCHTVLLLKPSEVWKWDVTSNFQFTHLPNVISICGVIINPSSDII